MSLSNLKSKAITLKDKIIKLERDGIDLDSKYIKVILYNCGNLLISIHLKGCLR